MEEKVTDLISTPDDQFLDQVAKAYEDDIVYRSNCKFCNHSKRAEAEQIFEKTGRYARVEDFFDKLHGENPEEYPKMHNTNVMLHLGHHYTNQKRAMHIREYARKIDIIAKARQSREQRVEQLSAILMTRMLEMLSDPTVDMFKANDSLVKMTKSLMELTDMQLKMEGEIANSDTVVHNLQQAFVYVINNERDVKVKQGLVKALDAFKKFQTSEIVTADVVTNDA